MEYSKAILGLFEDGLFPFFEATLFFFFVWGVEYSEANLGLVEDRRFFLLQLLPLRLEILSKCVWGAVWVYVCMSVCARTCVCMCVCVCVCECV